MTTESFRADQPTPANPKPDQGETFADPNAIQPQSDDSVAVLDYKGRKLTAGEIAKQLDRLEAKDDFIETLKRERAEDRSVMNQLLESLKSAGSAEALLAAQRAAGAANPAAQTPPPNQAVSADELAATVLTKVQEAANQERVTATRKENFSKVSSELSKRFGDAVDTKVHEVAAANGMTFGEALELAKTRPTVFLALFPKAAPAPSGLTSTRYPGTAAPVNPAAKRFHESRTTRDAVSAYTEALNEALRNHQQQ